MIKIQRGIRVRLQIGVIRRKGRRRRARPRLCPRFDRVVARPKFVGRVDVIVSVVCMVALGRAESLSHSKHVSFDEDSVGASDRLRAEGWNVRIKGEMLTWTGG